MILYQELGVIGVQVNCFIRSEPHVRPVEGSAHEMRADLAGHGARIRYIVVACERGFRLAAQGARDETPPPASAHVSRRACASAGGVGQPPLQFMRSLVALGRFHKDAGDRVEVLLEALLSSLEHLDNTAYIARGHDSV
jgi:hypothetical protein